MGSSEFEGDTLIQNLKKFKKQTNSIYALEVKLKGVPYVAWCVCSNNEVEDLTIAHTFFENELSPATRSYRLKEPSLLSNAYGTKEPLIHDICGWWALGDHPFALFRVRAAAILWLSSLRGDPWPAKASLEQSIDHWERMRNDPLACEEEPYGEYCACCDSFYDEEFDTDDHDYDRLHQCFNCPIALRTGKPECLNTPWRDAYQAWNKYLLDKTTEQKVLWTNAATQEIKFLKETLRMVETNEILPQSPTYEEK